jgi:thiol-disulfide isomerase/thioredoxin
MNRYRLVLITVAAVVTAAIAVAVFRPAAPPTLSAGAGSGVLPAQARVVAPDLTGIDGWLNSSPLSVSGLRGHVVLLDFWTFSCVNCVRTIPHLQQLYNAYRARGFLIVGIHSPEFDFEKVAANVKSAVKRLGVTWPVALDSEMATWNAYSTQYWPTEDLIDQQGRIAYVHFGEGDYDVTDHAVATLLGVTPATSAAATPVPSAITPELYAGSARGTLADGAAYAPQGQATDYPDTGPPRASDAIQVTGTWTDFGQYLQAGGPGHVRLRFHATDVFVVVGTSGGSLPVSVRLDGKPVPAAMSGAELGGSVFTITRQDLYHLIAHESTGDHLIDLSLPAGAQLYTFTFG